jgi:multidrug efflux pump subunit AcrA (membrane-fusion protein)
VDGEQIPGELVALQFNPDSQTHTHPIRIRVPGEKLLPGELGQVALPLRLRKDALVVPASALLREEGGYYLFLVRNGQLERRAVTPGVRLGEEQAIRSGIEVGDQVVARDVDVLSDGLKVQIEPERSAP